jgi:hypothetical protein
MLSNRIFIDMESSFSYIESCAGVVKLVDARDSKSREPQAHVGSIPTSGTLLVQSNTIGVRNFPLVILTKQNIRILMLSKFGLFAELISLTICPIYDSLLPILYMLSLSTTGW